ncbi:DUF6241 domain-containing protein [Bacillus toyonensis]|uniref:DUF6241 domain-containing protein n=1 Tax=Bacillus toyonensis TaxID=155322 RepID=UPI000B42F690|nr:DUF6241 domain-containing protein [Bacillus toyonensis]MED3201021.1 DUF6241 domain-containing protein [Bacillus toyonensis]OTX10868.1 hypothetical protein BK712_04730 [Bacillus thuringiensis serovar seoulensis]
MDRWAKHSMIVVGIVVFGVFIGYMVGTFFNPGSDNKQAQEKTIVAKGEEIDDLVNAEGVIIDSMHKMLHQKVIADKKIGFIVMSPENIKMLRHLLDQSDKMLDKEKYAEILNRWEKGDFSQAVEEHNYMWEQAGGESTGKAKRLTTPKEEKAYLKEQSEKEGSSIKIE